MRKAVEEGCLCRYCLHNYFIKVVAFFEILFFSIVNFLFLENFAIVVVSNNNLKPVPTGFDQAALFVEAMQVFVD